MLPISVQLKNFHTAGRILPIFYSFEMLSWDSDNIFHNIIESILKIHSEIIRWDFISNLSWWIWTTLTSKTHTSAKKDFQQKFYFLCGMPNKGHMYAVDYCFEGALRTHQKKCLTYLNLSLREEDTTPSNLNQQLSHFHLFDQRGSDCDISPSPIRVQTVDSVETPEIITKAQSLSVITYSSDSESNPQNPLTPRTAINHQTHQSSNCMTTTRQKKRKIRQIRSGSTSTGSDWELYSNELLPLESSVPQISQISTSSSPCSTRYDSFKQMSTNGGAAGGRLPNSFNGTTQPVTSILRTLIVNMPNNHTRLTVT